MFTQRRKLDVILGWVQGLSACFINLINTYGPSLGDGGRRLAAEGPPKQPSSTEASHLFPLKFGP